ncbi:HAD family hydrolase [Endothiovibrio diazotrophicus]
MKSTSIRTVLFDLDGTLADTAPDLVVALNTLRTEEGEPPLPFEAIRPHVSHGSQALLRFGFGLDDNDPRFPPLQQRLLDYYRAHVCDHTTLFPGMGELLEEIERRGLNWGVVTNKPARFTDPLMEALGLAGRAACIVSGDTTGRAKPHPEPMLHACRLAGSEAAQCLYLGDARRDIEAGENAGMTTLVALFGYLGEEDHPEQWNADGMIHTPLDTLAWL